MDQEITDEELEAVMRHKLGKLEPPPPAKLSTAEVRIAEQLLGRDNTAVLQRRVQHGERFRPKPVVVKYQYWRVGGTSFSMPTWQLARMENGRTTHQRAVLSDGELDKLVKELRRNGQDVSEFKVDGAPAPISRPKAAGGRKSFTDRYGPSFERR